MSNSFDVLRSTTESTSRNVAIAQVPQIYLLPGDQSSDAYHFSEVATLSQFLRPSGPNVMSQWTWSFWAKTSATILAMSGETSVWGAITNDIGTYFGLTQANETYVEIQGGPLSYGWNHLAFQSGWGGQVNLFLNGKKVATGDASGVYNAMDSIFISNMGTVGGSIRNIALFNYPLNDMQVFTLHLLGPRHDLMRLHGAYNSPPSYYWRGSQEDSTGNFIDSGVEASNIKIVPNGTSTWDLDGSDDLISARIAAGDERTVTFPIAMTGTSTTVLLPLKAPGLITSLYFHAITAPTSSQDIVMQIVNDVLEPISDTANIAGKTIDTVPFPTLGFFTNAGAYLRLTHAGGDVVNGLAQFILVGYIPIYTETPIS